MKYLNKIKNNYIFLLLAFAILLFLRFYSHTINSMNATMFAFSYKYGFISRGFIGTCYAFLNKITPMDIMNYRWLNRFVLFVTLVYVAIFFLLIVCVKKVAETTSQRHVAMIAFFFLMFTVPMFVGEYNYGRSDIYMAAVSLLSVLLILRRKAEWMVVPLSCIGVMVHQGYVFMFFNVVLVALIYRALSNEGKDRRKYILIFVFSLIGASAFFLYFELFSHMSGVDTYNSIVATAKRLSSDGTFHKDVIDKEVLGIDLSSRELVWKKINVLQFPIFLILLLPYLIFLFQIIRGLFSKRQKNFVGLKYIFVAIGVLTMLPDMLLKVDYGRWMYAIVFYYCVIFLFLFGERDALIIDLFQDQSLITNKNMLLAIGILAYPIIFQPLGDVYICQLTDTIVNFLNEHILHWWTYYDTHGVTVQSLLEIRRNV